MIKREIFNKKYELFIKKGVRMLILPYKYIKKSVAG